jgi:hypothetical protein
MCTHTHARARAHTHTTHVRMCARILSRLTLHYFNIIITGFIIQEVKLFSAIHIQKMPVLALFSDISFSHWPNI